MGVAYYFIGVYPRYWGLYAKKVYGSGFYIWKRAFTIGFFGKKKKYFFIFLKLGVIDVMA